jgi:phage/plasmid-associated DNA primase
MEERREYYRQLDEAELLASNRSGYDREGIDVEKIEARPEDINRYEVIGTEYFKVDSVTDNLIPWSKPMFEKLYGSRAIPTRLYDKFGYKPDYISETFPRDLGVDGKTRNIFIRPTYKIEPGNWDTIRGGLEHGFGDQIDLILEYAAISIAYPEAKLPNLWFIGKENKGKSAVVAIFKYLVGLQNVRKISTKALESDFTDFLGASQLVIVEEAGNWKNPNEVMSNLKDWTTEQDTQCVNPKYGKKYESPIHCKFMFTSNDWDSAPVSGDATRIWFVEINHEPKNKVSNYYQKVQDEMGHFVDYLIKQIVPTLKMKNGKLDTTNRLYFDPKQYDNSAKDFVKKLHKSPIYEAVMDTVCDFFEKYEDENECWFDLKAIKEANNWKYNKDPNNKDIKLMLKQELDLEPTNALDRPDSLRFIGDTKPNRRSKWYCVNRQQAIGDSIFNMEAISIA